MKPTDMIATELERNLGKKYTCTLRVDKMRGRERKREREREREREIENSRVRRAGSWLQHAVTGQNAQ